jgi:hypothetical protein
MLRKINKKLTTDWNLAKKPNFLILALLNSR